MDEELFQKSLNRAFRFLAYRPRSEKELRDFFKRRHRDIDDIMLTRVMDRLKELGYVDDLAFAEWWITARSGRNGVGAVRLKRELVAKGITDSIIETAIRSCRDDIGVSEYELARIQTKKKVRNWTGLSGEQRMRRLYGFLKRRGFSQDTVRRLIDEYARNGYNTSQDANADKDP